MSNSSQNVFETPQAIAKKIADADAVARAPARPFADAARRINRRVIEAQDHFQTLDRQILSFRPG